jgi:hypothetical protein
VITITFSYWWLLAAPFLFWWWATSAVEAYTVWKSLNLFNKCVHFPNLLIFGAADIALNYTVFCVFGFPPPSCFTISDRMEYYRQHAKETQSKALAVANFICDALNQLVVGGHHC